MINYKPLRDALKSLDECEPEYKKLYSSLQENEMTDDEILLMAEQSVNKLCVIAVTNDDLIAFAREIESRTLTNQKARWYQEGVEAEREACWKVCDEVHEEYYGQEGSSAAARCAYLISTRGE